MPLEIRNSIWALVLGDQLIHLEYLDTIAEFASNGQIENRQIWRHIVCDRDCPESVLIEESTRRDRNGDEETIWRQPHHHCDVQLAYEIGSEYEQPGHESMHLTALRVCRQMYIEANDVLWSTNTFSFNDAAISLDRFMSARTTRQKRSLRKLRLHMDWVWDEDKPYNRVLGMKLIKSLTGLRSLRLQINHSMEAAHYQQMKAFGDDLFQTRYLTFVHKMAVLPLTNVEVFVGDRSQSWYVELLWTAADRMEYAEGIRKILLDPKGAEIWAQNQEWLQRFSPTRQREKEGMPS